MPCKKQRKKMEATPQKQRKGTTGAKEAPAKAKARPPPEKPPPPRSAENQNQPKIQRHLWHQANNATKHHGLTHMIIMGGNISHRNAIAWPQEKLTG